MNTDVDIVAEANGALPPVEVFAGARLLFEEQEQRFSRFRDTSLVSELNRGHEVADGWLAAACRLALEAYEFTGGLFNPMVLEALRQAGYDRTFEEVAGGHPRMQAVPDPRACLSLDGDRVRLRTGRIDFGGIVKGWTADLVGRHFGAGFEGLLVNAGGDVRAMGAESGHDGWAMTVAAPGGGPAAWSGDLRGAMATSSALRRRWLAAGGESAHHLIDPRTGLPSAAEYAQATVWAPECWVAECWAKAVAIGGSEARADCEAAGLRVLAIPCADEGG
jgi:thiamine biosynthesis lipoprotein